MRVALASIVLAGCFAKPGAPGGGSVDGGGDDAPAGAGPSVRLVRNAWWSSLGNSPGMTSTRYSVPSASIAAGDLVLMIANIDNGGTTYYPATANGFTQLEQIYWGPSDRQTLWLAWKVATAGEPATYEATYTNTAGTGATTITLLAVTNYATASPIGNHVVDISNSLQTSVDSATNGVATTADDSAVIYVAAADWQIGNANAMFTPPMGFMPLAAFGDRGDVGMDWSTQIVAWKKQHATGQTGPVTSLTTCTTSASTKLEGYGLGAIITIPPGA